MGKFEAGDTIKNSAGDIATALESTEYVTLQWADGSKGIWDAKYFEKVTRSYKPGDFVRVIETGIVGMVFDDDGDPEDQEPFWVAEFDEVGEENPYSADELQPWVPLVGEEVLESGVDDDTVGNIVSVDGDRAIVMWDGFPFAQPFKLADLEPVDACDEDEDEDDFEIGDAVTYTNPFLAGEFQAQVVGFVTIT